MSTDSRSAFTWVDRTAGIVLASALTARRVLAKAPERRTPQHIAQDSSTSIAGHRARAARWPSALSEASWWNLLRRIKDDISEKKLVFIAAGVAFYGFLAILSGVVILASLGSLIFGPNVLRQHAQALQDALPEDLVRLLSDPHSTQTLGIGLLIALVIDLKAILSGSSCMLTAFRLAYGGKQDYTFIRRQTIVVILSVISVAFAIVSLILIVALPIALDLSPLSRLSKTVISVARWPILVVVIMTVLAMIYRYAPHRTEQRWQLASWGTVIAAVLWIAGSALFSVYVSEFTSYDKSYGVLGAVVILLMWLHLSAFVVLLGARLNVEFEHRLH